MQLSKIKADAWYRTKCAEGQIGRCVAKGKDSVKIQWSEGGSIWLSPKEVEYELPKGAEPNAEAPAPKPSDEFEFLRAVLERRIMQTVEAVDAAWKVAQNEQRDLLIDVGQALQKAGKKVAKAK